MEGGWKLPTSKLRTYCEGTCGLVLRMAAQGHDLLLGCVQQLPQTYYRSLKTTDISLRYRYFPGM